MACGTLSVKEGSKIFGQILFLTTQKGSDRISGREVHRTELQKPWDLDLRFHTCKVSGLAGVVFKVPSGSNILHF